MVVVDGDIKYVCVLLLVTECGSVIVCLRWMASHIYRICIIVVVVAQLVCFG